MFIDSHCHLDLPQLNNQLSEVLGRMHAAKVTHALCVCVDLLNFPRVLALAQNYSHLYATVGVHPDYKDDAVSEPSVADLVEKATHPKVLAIGETGLDYCRIGDGKISDLEWQRERFRKHIQAARKISKPLVIHTRNAALDTLAIMQEESADLAGGVMHCFTESWEVGKAALDLGFYLSFSGIVTFKNATAIQEVVKKTPLDRLLIETDAPYLAPVPNRGKTNEPAFVKYVAERVAELKKLDIETVALATSENFFKLFLKN